MSGRSSGIGSQAKGTKKTGGGTLLATLQENVDPLQVNSGRGVPKRTLSSGSEGDTDEYNNDSPPRKVCRSPSP